MKITFEVTTERIRQLGAKKGNVEHMSTQEAEAFMTLYKRDLELALGVTLKKFVDGKLETTA